MITEDIRYDASGLTFYYSGCSAGEKRMKVWLACFLLLFALAELFDWMQGFSFPLPIYILGGAFLAVASNYEKIVGSYFSDVSGTTTAKPAQLDSTTPGSPIVFDIAQTADKVEKTVIE
ncbi:hypothetical protein B6N60_02095 [Richelia sinica FACHB-800]|uniref:Uncharacterized protein n=2 Tax=Richelia TaxID=98443 RepID=A0A975T7M2_9NOST|nr:hypothetical protein B6N60_02095 [Richelia sinica FACHB-800]